MKTKDLFIAFFAGIISIIGLHIAETTFSDNAHKKVMKEYCTKSGALINECKKYDN